MEHSIPDHKRRLLVGDADRLIGWMRRGTVGLGGLVALLALLVAFFSLVEPTTFPRGTTLQALMFQVPELGLLSLAMAIPLISGGINLAIIATANLSGLLMAWILIAVMPPEAVGAELAWWLLLALVAGLVLCAIVGLVTGLLVAVVGVHPILVTLGTMTLLHGISIYFTRGRTLSGFPEPLIAVANETIFGIPISFVLFTLVAVAVHVFLTRTALGIRIHMIGSNPEATRFSGVDTARVLVCGLSAFQPALLAGGGGDDGALQRGRRRHRPILPSHHDPRCHPRRHRPLWRLRADRRTVRGADHPPGDRERVQHHGAQPAPRPGVVGRDPAPGRRDKAGEIRLRPGSPAAMMID